jgi:hypothetical protein
VLGGEAGHLLFSYARKGIPDEQAIRQFAERRVDCSGQTRCAPGYLQVCRRPMNLFEAHEIAVPCNEIEQKRERVALHVAGIELFR